MYPEGERTTCKSTLKRVDLFCLTITHLIMCVVTDLQL